MYTFLFRRVTEIESYRLENSSQERTCRCSNGSGSGQRPNAVAGASRSIAKVECAGCVAVNRLPPNMFADNLYYVILYMKGDALQRNTSTVNVNRQYRVLALPE
jgi:hypothetical protein